MPGSGFFCPGPSYCAGAGRFIAVRFCSRAWSWSWSVVWFAKHTFTERIRYDTDNIYVSNEAYINMIEAMYRSEIVTRPDGTSYVQCIRINGLSQDLTPEQQQIADQIKAWDAAE